MKGATKARAVVAIAAAALAAACAAAPDDDRVGERLLPDTRVVAEHFERAVVMQGPYAFQLPRQPETPPPPASAPGPAKPSMWARLWPAARAAEQAPPPMPVTAPPPRPSFSLWDHLWPPLTPAKADTPGADAVAGASPAIVRTPSPRPVVAAVAAPATPTAETGGRSGLSEFRVGALKHAVAFGRRAKEPGMDGNVEALFRSPGWLAWAWSPRPTLGLTANASRRSTDFLYGGLTWEWAYRDALFVGLGLGLSLHDGMLDNSMIGAKSRSDRREFGCRGLFRGSLELGYRFTDRHSLSVMWAHHGNATLCGDDNDGIDNAGLRYGYRM